MGRHNIIDSQLSYLEQQANITLDNQSGAPSESPMVLQAPWVAPPPGFQAFDYQGIISTPLVGSGENTVLSFIVPRGWDGVIKRLSHTYTGNSYPEGSGGIIWRILADKRAIKNYESMTFSFGSLQAPRSTDGIIITENQLIEYMVNVVGTGGFIPAAATSIICTLAGWIWPRRS